MIRPDALRWSVTGAERQLASLLGAVPRWGLNAQRAGGRTKDLPRIRSVFLAALLAACGAEADHATKTSAEVRHVFVIVLENKGFAETFDMPATYPFLARQLPAMGQLLRRYYAIGHASLDNYIAMISGQAPNPDTNHDCQIYHDLVSPNGGALDSNGQATGIGCIYPTTVLTIADQLAAAGLRWRGYMQDMASNCLRPALNGVDTFGSAPVPGASYVAHHNPFIYFHGLLDSGACNTNDVPLSQLTLDLQTVEGTPSFSLISPNLCVDGAPALDCPSGAKTGAAAADAFLQQWVPLITSSRAFQKDGLLVITFDEADVDPPNQDAAACCGELPGPSNPMPGLFGPGGGRVGAVVISPLVVPGTVNDSPYNHYALLRTVENLFGLEHLGFAGQNGLLGFGPDVFGNGIQPVGSETH